MSITTISTSFTSKGMGSHPNPPRLTKNDKPDQLVKIILGTIDKIKKTPNYHKRIKKSENLTYSLVTELRRARADDHLLHTTAIWALITLFRRDPDTLKELMIVAGVPGVLYEILKNEFLSGATRQYATELCSFLCSTQSTVLPIGKENDIGPMVKFPRIEVTNRIDPMKLDDSSLAGSDVSSLQDYKPGFDPFQPYRIDDYNLKKLDAIFSGKKPDIKLSPRLPFEMKEDISDTESVGSVGSSISFSDSSMHSDIPFYAATNANLLYQKNLRKGAAKSYGIMLGGTDKALTEDFLGSNMSIASSVSSHTYYRDEYSQIGDNHKHALYGGELMSISHSHRVPALLPHSKRERRMDGSDAMLGKPRNMFGLGRSLDLDNTSQAAASVFTHSGLINPSHSKSVDLTVHKKKIRKQETPRDNIPTLPISLESIASITASRSKLSINSGIESADIPDLLATIDPLSLNVSAGYHAAFNEDVRSLASDPDDSGSSDDDDESIEGKLDDDMISLDGDGVALIKRKNPFTAKRKMRIRAEKLIDLSFTKRLFNTKASISDMQSFIQRFETILELMDKESSGYITWEAFARIIISLAPQELLRADVVAFLEAQSDDQQALVDYKEFLISGKVMVVQKQNGRSILPLNGWLERQRMYAGDASTYTWKNHVKWYRRRTAHAIIWLMRRAAKAMGYSSILQQAQDYLRKVATKAKAYTFLIEVAWCAEQSHQRRLNAKKNLMLRTYHARRYMARVEEALMFLKYSAKGLVDAEKKDGKPQLTYLPPKPKQADYGNLYRLLKLKSDAFKDLLGFAKWARDLQKRRMEELEWLISIGQRTKAQAVLRARAQQWLYEFAERAHAFGVIQDNAWVSLLRIGGEALKHMINQETCLDWLIARGNRAQLHVQRQAEIESGLQKFGQFKLRYMNNREHGYAWLFARRIRGEKLIKNRIKAANWLRNRPILFWKQEELVANAFVWLTDRGNRAKDHALKQAKAKTRLTFFAKRSHRQKQRLALAYLDLQQWGEIAKLKSFESNWPKPAANQARWREETFRISKNDRKYNKQRKGTNYKERWKMELQDAFKVFVDFSKLPGGDVTSNLIGRISFYRILLNGQLLNMIPQEMSESWRSIDTDSSGCIAFGDLWSWFVLKAERLHKERKELGNKEGYVFRLHNIFSAKERAIIVLMKRFKESEAKNYLEENDPFAIYGNNKYKDGYISSDAESDDDDDASDGSFEHDEDSIPAYIKIYKKQQEDEEKQKQLEQQAIEDEPDEDFNA